MNENAKEPGEAAPDDDDAQAKAPNDVGDVDKAPASTEAATADAREPEPQSEPELQSELQAAPQERTGAPSEDPSADAKTPQESADESAVVSADESADESAAEAEPSADDSDPPNAGSSADADETPDAAQAKSDEAAAAAAAEDRRRRDAEAIRQLFTRSAESVEGAPEDPAQRFRFARWGRPLAPVVLGLDEESAEAARAAVVEAAEAAGVGAVDEDPDLEANFLICVCEKWSQLKSISGLDRLIPDLERLLTLLSAVGANQYRIFRVAPEEGISFAVTLVRFDESVAGLSAQAIGATQAAHGLLMWSDEAFAEDAPVAINRSGRGVIKTFHAKLLKAAYGEDAPSTSEDPNLADQLAAAMAAMPDSPRPRRPRRRSGKS